MNILPNKKITIDDVAKECRVSKTTISRYLNGNYNNFSAETRERICAVINDLNYKPDKTAQRLKSSVSMLIGCVIADISSPFSALLLKGITTVCEEAGYQVLFADSQGSAAKEQKIVEGFLENRVDGLIINTCGGNDEYLLTLQSRGVHVVLADRELMTGGQMDTVTSPNIKAAYEITCFLFKQGYENVAFFSESMRNVSPRFLRHEGYLKAVKEFGLQPETYEFNDTDLSKTVSSLRQFINAHSGKRIAIISSNGTTTQRIIMSVNEMGLELGYWLGLCTFDDWSWLQIVKPKITAVVQGNGETGIQSARLLLDRISGRKAGDVPPETRLVSSRLQVRESTPNMQGK